ncbi:MAG: extracellular solute-binding protein [Oscillospiraceae bacterium]|nr:extracellular solute-binding protein [Oscillospiraceae bacterium]
MAKKTVALLLVALMVVAMFAGCNSNSGSAATTAAAAATTAAAGKATTAAAASTTAAAAPAGSGKLFDEPVTFDMWIVEHSSYMYDPENWMEKQFNEDWNVFLNVTPFQDGINDKINLGLASGDLPDIAHNFGVTDATNWGLQGALIDFNSYGDLMDDYNAWKANYGMEDFCSYYISPNGAMYVLPNYGFGTGSNSTFWIYRRDLFEKHGLEVPENDTELYEVSKALKAEYPDSYPFANRSWPSIMGRIAHQWGTPSYGFYYNNDMQAWTYGALEDNFEEALNFMAKMYAEELIPVNTLSLDTAGWQELVSTNKGFIFSDYQARIDFFNTPMRATDPTVAFAYMKPFEGGGSGIRTFHSQSQLIISGYIGFVTCEEPEKLVTFLDEMYTDESEVLMTWGKEGETFVTNADGSKSYAGAALEAVKTEAMSLYSKFGFYQRGFWCRIDPLGGTVAVGSPETLEAVAGVKTDSAAYTIPSISFSEENKKVYDQYNEAINTHVTENLGKFLTGQRPMSEYADFKAELEGLGVQTLTDLYNKQQAELNALLG